MKLYIKNYSSYKSDLESINIKETLKERYKLDTRRQDDFIYLALLGAQRLKEKTQINQDDELYITSGVGNIDVLQRTDNYVNEEKQFVKPIDFINMLGNTTSYYVGTSLGLRGKNIFQISDNFTFLNSLVSIYASLNASKKEAILGSIDLVDTPYQVIKRVLGINESREVISSANYQKLSLSSLGALACIEFDTKIYSHQEIQNLLAKSDMKPLFCARCKEFTRENESKFFETMISYAINKALQEKEDTLFVECFEEKYKILTLKSLA